MDPDHNIYIQRCLQIAEKGLGRTAPNPMVGAVIVHNGQIIGEGFHELFGEPHAEVNAITSVENKHLLRESTLYLSLEPCNHFGKTPPCTDLILDSEIPKVIVGTLDPNPLVAGQGIEKLKKNGVSVTIGVLEKECRFLNRRFITFYENKRPYIILKWAKTTDDYIDSERLPDEPPRVKWITNEECKVLVHKWRTEEPAILIGTNTALYDNPHLTARLWPGKNPQRIVIDRNNRLPGTLNIFNQEAKTLLFGTARNLPGVEIISGNTELNLSQIIHSLYLHRIQSVIVEGGAGLLNSFIREGLWDEARVFTGSMSFGAGVASPQISGTPAKKEFIGNSTLETFFNNEWSA